MSTRTEFGLVNSTLLATCRWLLAAGLPRVDCILYGVPMRVAGLPPSSTAQRGSATARCRSQSRLSCILRSPCGVPVRELLCVKEAHTSDARIEDRAGSAGGAQLQDGAVKETTN